LWSSLPEGWTEATETTSTSDAGDLVGDGAQLLVCAIVVFDMPVLVLTPRLTELVSTKHVFQAADLLESEYLV
jgi:hypothetical protein